MVHRNTLALWKVLAGVVAAGVSCGACASLLGAARPQGQPSSEAEQLTDRMLQQLHSAGFEHTGALRFRMGNARPLILWDRERSFVEVRHDDGLRVLLDLNSRLAVADRAGIAVKNEELPKLADDAYAVWANDSFWLVAPFKVRDPGTQRSVVEDATGSGLLVEYTSGGVTPGDAYLWEFDDAGRPLAWRMWVQVLPIGGLRVEWRDWVTLPTGAVVAKTRALGGVSFHFDPLEAAAHLDELVGTGDPFGPLEARLRKE
ncbi:MAG: hypothetical protein ACO3JL_17360 [Myxococcota bacterium]